MLKIGIVGLPNVGKSTLFNALLKSPLAEAANFAFTTIEPNIGVVEVPDERVDKIGEIENSKRIIYPAIEFVDIAGLIAGAHKGEGLGNRFLANIREVDAIAMVIRTFENKDVMHVGGELSPKNDLETILTELALADLETVSKRKNMLKKEFRSNQKEYETIKNILEKIEKVLEDGLPAHRAELNDDERVLVKDLNLLTIKPFIYVFNVGEDEITSDPSDIIEENDLGEYANEENSVTVSAVVEAELATFDDEKDRLDYLTDLGVGEPGLNKLVKRAYQVLNLKSFLTAGEMEARAWAFCEGDTIRQAVGAIHGDFTDRFIKAEVVSYDDFVSFGGWRGAKEKGKVRIEGKQYLVKDGDVVYVHHN